MLRVLLIISYVTILLSAAELISPIPESIPIDVHKAELGEALFHDSRLSKDDTIACVSCHNLELGGADGLSVSFGINGQTGSRNSPTVFNSIYNFSQFWDGRAKNLKEQAVGPIENPVEMGFNLSELVVKLKQTEYKTKFKKLYPEGITKESITDAIAEYEKSLITPNSDFDRYLKGDLNAISEESKAGYSLFKTKGCIACHQGINIGGNMYSTFGIMMEHIGPDLGRQLITKRASDKYVFKVPSLRNVAQTAPYFHDGSAKTLEDAIEKMAMLQLGREINHHEMKKIISFLRTLSAPVKPYK